MSKESNSISVKLTETFVEILKNEGDRAYALCMDLNKDQAFLAGMSSIVKDDFKNISYKAEHVLLRDLVTIYKEFVFTAIEKDNIPVNARFILVYMYERLQGNDLIKQYDLKKLNELIVSSQFNKNIHIINNISFFEPQQDVAEEFAMPSILSKINHEHFLSMTSLMNRIVSLIVKSDGTVTSKEEEFLKRISGRINNPAVKVNHAKYNEVPENDTLEIVMTELKELIGLDEIKKNVEDLTNFLKVQKMREEKGLKILTNSLHAVFMGPPGTGKTTVARLLGRIYKHLGYLKKGHLVETDRAGMVAGYVGQTAIKTDEIIKSAIGGVLFIDEAYSLASGSFNDFGHEAIEVLLKRMEDSRDNLVIVVAGYSDEIEIFIQSNPGLQSRFNRYFKFDHFSSVDLLKIFKLIAAKADVVLSEDAEEKLTEILDRLYEKRHRGFGNARVVRNLFEKIIERQANRIVSISPVTPELLMTITEEDVPDVLKTVKEIIMFEEEDVESTDDQASKK